jgi:hydroxymethylglutaryl-CoA synthase
MIGIISYGTYIPSFRIRTSDIADFWGKNGSEIAETLGVFEKSVPAVDEDTATLAVEAALRAISTLRPPISHLDIEALMVGSESHPYIVKPTSTIVGSLLGLNENYLALDTEFACKAATGAMQLVSGLVESERIKLGLIIGADTAQAKMGDALEYTASAAATAIILGNQKPIAQILDFTSYSSDTPDFWRREGQKHPSHAGRFTGEPAYFKHILGASTSLLEKTQMKPSQFDYVVFHMPNAKFPKTIAKKLGFSERQINPGFVVEQIGNPYSASSLTGLAAILDIAKPNQKIFLCSYGSGAGSDAFYIKTTQNLLNHQKENPWKISEQIANKKYITYPELLKLMQQIGQL